MEESVHGGNLTENFLNGIFFTNAAFLVEYFYISKDSLAAIRSEDVVGRSIFDVFPELSDCTCAIDEDVIRQLEYDGSPIFVRVIHDVSQKADGTPESTYIFIVYDSRVISLASELDNTKRVLAELQEIIENSFDGILVTDGKGNVLLMNDSYVRNTNLQREELMGHNMREFINPVWMKDSVALMVIEQRRAISMHHTTRHGKNIMVTGVPIFDEKERIKKVVLNSRDISEIYELREELSKAKEMERLFFDASREPDDLVSPGMGEIVAADQKTRQLFQIGEKIANFNTTVLITGESGAGKDVLANFIHKSSALRSANPFIAVNCGAIPENLMESELFGYEEGAFTGAVRGGKVGLIEAAEGGTLFLDEISELDLNLQVKLLRALETTSIMRLGSQKIIPVDFRVIAATNKDLKEQVAAGLFREDLYYRLSVIGIEIPPLRERPKDIDMLTIRFLRHYNKLYGLDKKITYEVLKMLEEYPWPGNIRELKNVIENMVVLSNNEYLQLDDLPWISGDLARRAEEKRGGTLQEQMEAYEREVLRNAQRKYGSSRKMAEALEVDQSTIIRKMKKLKI
ncbi:MAG: sigma 54-interacting transcriptional regulator [Clostridiales Family XIII bacterium]|jgi:PAS domain S-box-containing protein/TyrR family helix-turn-helix protein|nr:sigma 54-interacting transcriptional regulator [Clostridiales Family XIII bacterium]